MKRVRIAAQTEVGARKGNEDDFRHGHSALGHYAVLADGAGGHAGGAEASHAAVVSIEKGLCSPDASFTPARLDAVVREAHAELLRQSAHLPQGSMHTTVVVLWLDATAQHALWSHVGDSRLYRFRHGRAELLTVDDSVVQQMVLAGILDAAQSRNHPKKNHLVAALGIEGEIDPHTVARAVHLLEGDAYLLCSDGWWDHFEPDSMAEALHRASTPEAWLQDMQTHVQRQAAPRQDNFTAVAVWVGDPSQMTIARFEDTVPRGQAPR